MNSSSSSSSGLVLIDLTDDEPGKDSAYLCELETLRVQNRKLEHENSKLKLKLRETQDELKFTRESLGQAVVAMQVCAGLAFSLYCIGLILSLVLPRGRRPQPLSRLLSHPLRPSS